MRGVFSKLKKRWPNDNTHKDTGGHNDAGTNTVSSTSTSPPTTQHIGSALGRANSSSVQNNGVQNNGGGKPGSGGNGVADLSGMVNPDVEGSRVVTVGANLGGQGPGGQGGPGRGAAGGGGVSEGARGVATGVAHSPPLEGALTQRQYSGEKMPPPGIDSMGGLPGGMLVAPVSTTTQPLRHNGVEGTPFADISLPRRPSQTISRRSPSFESSRSTEHHHVRPEYLKELPLLRNTAPHQQPVLFQQKLKLCSVVFDMTDPMENAGDKEVKRSTLLELVDHVNSPHGQQIFTVAVMPDVIAMVKANVCRALPPQDDCDPDKDEPLLEEAWPHLQVVYEFLVRFVVSAEVDAKQAKQYVDQPLCLQLVELFDSEDPRERDYLKTILHRVYGKFMMHRAFIRRAVGNAFLRFVYECPRHNGIGELLEILGSIVNGFATPLKKEHVDFLQVCLLPLHTPSMVNAYHQQLSYCVVQYVEKEAETAAHILKSLIRFWPWRSSSKQVIFLNELEEVLELLVGSEQIAEVEDQLFNLLARCISSEHFQVAERALFLWNNEHLVTVGVLSPQYPNPLLPVIYGPLHKRSTKHWNTTVEGLAHNVLRMYNEQDAAAFERCHQRHLVEEEERARRRSRADEHWQRLEELAHAKGE